MRYDVNQTNCKRKYWSGIENHNRIKLIGKILNCEEGSCFKAIRHDL